MMVIGRNRFMVALTCSTTLVVRFSGRADAAPRISARVLARHFSTSSRRRGKIIPSPCKVPMPPMPPMPPSVAGRHLSINRGGASSSTAGESDGEGFARRRRRRGKAEESIRRFVSTLFSAVGFLSSSATSLVANRKQFGEWRRCMEVLDAYLKDSGIEDEIDPLINARLLDNLVILGRIQSAMLQGRDIRDLARARNRRLHGSKSTNFDLPSHEEAARYMKYATSAYGESMIRAAEMQVKGKFDSDVAIFLSREKIAKHVGLPEEDIIVMDLDDGSDSNHLRHFVAVDRVNRNVVLSIRGTFNIAELVIDVAAFSRPFMGGEAHSEMATMAEKVWDKTGETVRELLKESGEEYGLVITGHSLGAGTACLMSILVHQDRRRHVHGRRVRCFAYASPPVFSPLGVAPKEAIQSTTNYMHESDAIPFLSIDSVRHFFSCIAVIEKRTKEMSWLERKKLATGYKAADESLCKEVTRASLGRLPPKRGAPVLACPAASTIWVRRNDADGRYDARECDSIRLAKLGIFVCRSMLFDHFPTGYENALDNLSGFKSK